MFFLLSFVLNAQTFHFSTYKANSPDEGAEIGIFDISTCQTSLIGDQDGSIFLSDLSFFSDSSLWTITPLAWGSNPPSTLWEINFFPNINPTFYSLFGTGTQNFLSDDDGVGMTCGPLGNLYISGKGISVHSGGFAAPTYLGDLPPTMESQGDITYREGKFYISTTQNSLVEVDMNNPMNSSIVFEFPQNTPPIHGLATVEIDCDSFITYASGLTATGSIIYELDFVNQTLIEKCQTNKFILGLASMSECFIPECEVSVDLDLDDSSGAINNDYETGTVCVPPVSIVDTDVSVFSETDIIDSIKVSILNALTTEEYLSLPISINNISILGLGTLSITLVNNGNGTQGDFENALANILYYNDANPLVLGTRTIEIIAYSLGVESDPAVSNIIIGNSEVYITYDSTNVLCYGSSEGVIMTEPFGGTHPYNYMWSTNETSQNITQLAVGIYQVTVTDTYGCTTIEEIQISQPDTLGASISIFGNIVICDSSAQLIGGGSGGVPPYQYTWNTGAITEELSNAVPGLYSLTITDQNECESFAAVQIDEGIDIVVNEEVFLCEGETIVINNEVHSSDTTICNSYILDNGCDSMYCYVLEFEETVYSNFYEEICQGDSFIWNGEILNSDTLIITNHTSSSGCDSIVEFILDVHDYMPIIFSTVGNLCNDQMVEIAVNPYDSYLWSTGEISQIIVVNTEGIYNVTVIDSNNCEFFEEIEITGELEVTYQISSPTCFGFTDGLIQVDSIIGGTAPFLYSINNEPFQQSSLFENLSSGDFSIMIEDVNGCQKEIEITLNEPLESTLEIEGFHEINLGESINLSLTTNILDPTIQWHPPLYLNCDTCLNVVSTPSNSIMYEILSIDGAGCVTTTSVQIEVDRILDIFIPNAFTPNDDGFNDWFTIYGGVSISSIKYLKIFNRWGEVVFERKDFLPNVESLGWNGMFRNKKMPSGVYTYLVETNLSDGSIEMISGDFTLIR